jgi:hypothetical protein
MHQVTVVRLEEIPDNIRALNNVAMLKSSIGLLNESAAHMVKFSFFLSSESPMLSPKYQLCEGETYQMTKPQEGHFARRSLKQI